MKNTGIMLGCMVILVGMMVVPAFAKGGFDKWGYNYQAHIFNGLYENYSRPELPVTESDTELLMKWSDTWLSNKDRNGDGDLDRGYPTGSEPWTSSAAEGAWLTNHQRGSYIGDDGKEHHWTYFVKIVFPPGGVVDDNDDKVDDNTGGSIIWGAYVRIQQVYNDPYDGYHGLEFKVVGPAGFGAYK